MLRNMLSRIFIALITASALVYFLFSWYNHASMSGLAEYRPGKHADIQADRQGAFGSTLVSPAAAPGVNPGRKQDPKTNHDPSALLPQLPPAIAIVSMLYGTPAHYYTRAIQSYERYAEQYGYPMYVMRREVTEGLIQGVWNKCAYILHVLVVELQKPPEERAQWLLWADADSILANPSIPLDIFLPPEDFQHINVVASKDESGFNMGIFFLRVHPWSVTYMSKVLAYPIFNPNADLFWKEQSASTIIFKEEDNQDHILYQPRLWWNPYRRRELFEGETGAVIVHFPNLSGWREEHMVEYLEYVESPSPSVWEIPLEKSIYPAELEQFWATVRYGRDTVDQMHKSLSEWKNASTTFKVSFKHLEEVMRDSTDDIRMVRKAADDVHRAYEIYEKGNSRGFPADHQSHGS